MNDIRKKNAAVDQRSIETGENQSRIQNFDTFLKTKQKKKTFEQKNEIDKEKLTDSHGSSFVRFKTTIDELSGRNDKSSDDDEVEIEFELERESNVDCSARIFKAKRSRHDRFDLKDEKFYLVQNFDRFDRHNRC